MPDDNAWQFAVHSAQLLPHKPVGIALSERPVVLYRKADGTAVALEDRCPHRWAPLSDGRIEGDHIVCPHHGFKFCPQGHLVETSGKTRTPGVGSAKVYPVQEREGTIRVCVERHTLKPGSLQKGLA